MEKLSISPHIVVVGAGVIGLTTAIEVQATFPDAKVTIIAEYLPEDPKISKYASQWAGASYHIVTDDKFQRDLEAATLKRLHNIFAHDPSVPIFMAPQVCIYDDENYLNCAIRRNEGIVTEIERLDKAALPKGAFGGFTYETFFFDTPNYLNWLTSKLKAKGTTFVKSHLSHISEAFTIHKASVIINCSGLGALNLGGVKDETMYPTRGQTILIKAPWIRKGMTRSGPQTDVTYVIPRKSGNVILGGTRTAHDWDDKPRTETTEKIIKNALILCPELLPAEKRKSGGIESLEIIEHCVGFRPTRTNGIRIEVDRLNISSGQSIPLIHCYGHDGAGYQSSWGSAELVAKLLHSTLASERSSAA